MKKVVFSIITILSLCLCLSSCRFFRNRKNQVSTPRIEVSDDGYIVVNDKKTEHKVDKEDEITISPDGYLVINGNKTIYKAHVHEYGEWNVINNRTESEDGVYERKCVCGEKQTKIIACSGSVGLVYLVDTKANEATVYSIGSCESNDIVIPDTIKGVKVTKINENVFRGLTNIASVKIGNNVTEISDYAFCDCTNLSSIFIGNSVTSIGKSAFQSCTNLSNLVLPQSLNYIGESAFCNCTSISEITIPSGITSIEYATFAYCNLKSIEVPEGVTYISRDAFFYCSNLEEIIIPKSLQSISLGAFNITKLSRVYYFGEASDWNKIAIDYYCNDKLSTAIKYYFSENEPNNNSSTYWHYIDNVPTVWEDTLSDP